MSSRKRNRWIEQTKEKVLFTQRNTDKATKELLFLYDEAANEVEKEINTLFARYAKDNKLSNAEAERLLTGKEYSTWRKSMEEYLKEIPKDAKGSKTLLELNTLSVKSRISRKEVLLSGIYQQMINLAHDSNTKLEDLLGDILRVSYYRGAYELQRGMGLQWQVAKINAKTVRDIISYPWSNKHFSSTLWDNVDRLAATAKREITYGFIKGSSVQDMARQINSVMGKGRYAAERLVRTECKYFASRGELETYRAHNIQQYRFIGGSEGQTCDCARWNGEVIALDAAEPGVNLPPLHPNCLCTIEAEVNIKMFRDNPDVTPLKDNPKYIEWARRQGIA